MTETVWERRDCVSAQVEDTIVLLDLETLVYHSLNTTAAAVWDLLAEPKSTAALTDELCSRYKVTPEHCRSSVETLMETLSKNRLVQSKPTETQPAGEPS